MISSSIRRAEPSMQFPSPSLKRKLHIADHQSYQGPMTGKVAEQKLRDAGKNCYLTRYSSVQKKYVLSVVKRRINNNPAVFQHFGILITQRYEQNQYEIDGAEKRFDDISELLNFYQNHNVTRDIDSIGVCYVEGKRCNFH